MPAAWLRGHRPLDYWGRSLLDHFLLLLPGLLADDGRALVMQLSIVGQQETARRLAASGLEARVVDFGFFSFGPLFEANKAQIERVDVVGVHAPQHHVDAFEGAQRPHPQPAVAHHEVGALDQRKAQHGGQDQRTDGGIGDPEPGERQRGDLEREPGADDVQPGGAKDLAPARLAIQFPCPHVR